jgi:hypothetical protein
MRCDATCEFACNVKGRVLAGNSPETGRENLLTFPPKVAVSHLVATG